MSTKLDIIDLVHKAARKKVLFLPHAIRQMSHPSRMISITEVRQVIEKGEMIEDYPEDIRGHSCLIFGYGEYGRPIHVVCSPKPDYLAVITAYLPDLEQWGDNFRKRKNI